MTGPRVALAGVAAAALALAAVGCGSGSKVPSVASLGGSDPSTSTGSGDSGATASGGPRFGGSVVIGTKNGLAFSKCMRAHGVKNFPDPNAQGQVVIAGNAGIDPGSRTFQAAQQACQKVLPNGGQPSPAQLARMRRAALAFSACMRAHGLPDFPDPVFLNGGAAIHLQGGPGTGLDPSSPTFQAAQRACNGKLPGKGAAGTSVAGGK